MNLGIREYLFILVLLSVPVASLFLVFKPRNEEIQAAKLEIENKSEMLSRLEIVSTQIDDLSSAISDGREAVQVIEAKLPNAENVDNVLSQLSQMGKRHNLNVDAVTPERKVPAAHYMELPIKVELTGDFDGFYNFLLDIEQMSRLTRMMELNMTRSGDENGEMKATFILSVYFEPSKTGDASGTPSLVGVTP
ncbi:MAG: type 4a pilus biogenesis protein PilO [Planctomycetota bacterium]